mgnify:CR=1 FL=1
MKTIINNGIIIDIILGSLNTYLNTLNKPNINKRVNIILTKFIIYIYINILFFVFAFLFFV